MGGQDTDWSDAVSAHVVIVEESAEARTGRAAHPRSAVRRGARAVSGRAGLGGGVECGEGGEEEKGRGPSGACDDEKTGFLASIASACGCGFERVRFRRHYETLSIDCTVPLS